MFESSADNRTEELGCGGIETPVSDESLVTAFERVAVTYPSRIALSSQTWRSTYRELNERANGLAHRLLACGLGSGDRVAILMSHDTPMVAAILGILKAGQIAVALDADDPAARLQMLVEDAEPSIIVTDAQNETLAAQFDRPGRHILNLESETAIGSVKNLSTKIPAGQTAFLTYTSGSTGRPKAVMQTHRQLRRAAAAHTDAMQYTESDRIPLLARLSTGQGTVGLWCVFLNGATLYPFPVKTKGVAGLAEWIIDCGLTVYVSSASIFRTLMKTIDDQLVFSKVRAVRLASEAVTADDFREFCKHFPSTSVLVHGLSSTETSNIAWSRWAQDDEIPEGVLPVGHFSRDMNVTLVGDDGHAVAQGEIGEIMVTSRYVAGGYWRDPELTRKRFSADLDGKGTRQVRTGDLGRINSDGFLEFAGRKDDRIKIRGNRIELLDIDRTLEKLPGVERAAAVAIPRERHDPLLVAFVVKKNELCTPQRLRHAMRANLPLHLVPSKIVFLDRLPYNRGNKIDREALRQYSLPVFHDDKAEEPQSHTELLLTDIWAEVLDLSQISRDADFFSIGGDSLSGAIVAARIYALLGIELDLGVIADHPTLSSLAAYIDGCQRTVSGTPPITRAPRGKPTPLSSFQADIWDYCQAGGGTIASSDRIIGPLDVEIVKQCLSFLVNRHEILRTTFGLSHGCPVQIIHSSGPAGFSFIDLKGADDAEHQANLILCEAASQKMDLTRLPIIRHVLIRISDNNFRLARISNTLILDGFSGRTLDTEFAILYEAGLQGLEPPLPKEAALQYADYAAWQALQRRDTPSQNEAADWWTERLLSAPQTTRLPFRRLRRRAKLDIGEGVLPWTMEESIARRLDELARSVGVTHFVLRLAVFAALLADTTDNSSVLIATTFDPRDRVETHGIVGRFAFVGSSVFTHDPGKTFLEWLEIVRDTVFRTKIRGEIPYHDVGARLRALGRKMPATQVAFTMSSDHSDQHFGNLAIRTEFWRVGTVPVGCTVYFDEKRPENCRLNFDTRRFNGDEMRIMLDRYLRLLEAAARAPELSIGKLLATIGPKPLRWTYANYGWTFYDEIRRYLSSRMS
jgi:amino acid adenylation domain-containing protein